LWPLVESLIHDIYPVAETAGTRLINKVPDDLVVWADANLIKRVLQNLIANAIKYTPKGSVIVDARKLDSTGGIECSVADNGSGIPESLIPRVFDKGEVGPQNQGGLGLGLAIVKTFIEAHGGSVTVQSIEHKGTTFRFSLPGRAEISR
jgi:two-component system phosphate regulon sensor histidine kinase PhoR